MADNKTRTPFPTGPSLVTIKWVDLETSSQKGTPLARFTLEGAAGQAEGLTIMERCYLTDNAIWRLEDMAICVGADAASTVSAAKGGDALTMMKPFLGKGLKVVVKEDNYTDREGIARVGRKIVALESLDPSIKGYMERRRKARISGGTLTEAPPVASSAATDADIPF